jgi:hypothetical protein
MKRIKVDCLCTGSRFPAADCRSCPFLAPIQEKDFTRQYRYKIISPCVVISIAKSHFFYCSRHLLQSDPGSEKSDFGSIRSHQMYCMFSFPVLKTTFFCIEEVKVSIRHFGKFYELIWLPYLFKFYFGRIAGFFSVSGTCIRYRDIWRD